MSTRPLLGVALTALLGVGLGSPALTAGTPTPPTSATASAPAPAGTATSTAPAPSGTATSTAPAARPTGSAAAPAPSSTPGATHPVNVGGVLFVSGVRTTYHPSWDPIGGTLHVELTVRNATDQVVDASASIGAATLLGVDLGNADSIAVQGLNPGEVRTVGTDIEGVGQWGPLRAHVTVTPPATLRGVTLQPLSRDRWLLVPPWYLLALVAAVGALWWVLRHYRLVLAPRPAGGPRHGAGGTAPEVVVP